MTPNINNYMSKLFYSGYVYESLNEKELKFVYQKMQNSIENLNTALNVVHDGNQKKAISSLMKKTIDTFNEKIKGVDYRQGHPERDGALNSAPEDRVEEEKSETDDLSNG